MLPPRRLAALLLCALVVAPLGGRLAVADPAYFWLSESGASPSGPEAPAISLTEGDSDTLYLWARPIPGKRLRNFSLNLVADKSGVDFDDSGFAILNAISGSVERFEYTKDSSTTPALESDWDQVDVAGGQIDAVYDLQAFTLIADPDLRGIGPGCLSGDANCHEATDGDPAWLVATIDINATTAGTVNLNLQIGDLGMIHETVADGDYNYDGTVDIDDYLLWQSDFGSTTDLSADGDGSGEVDAADYTLWRDNLGATGTVETAADTSVVFGYDTSLDTEPEYDASTDRSTNLTFEDADAVITISVASPVLATPEPSAGALLLAVLVALGSQRADQKAQA